MIDDYFLNVLFAEDQKGGLWNVHMQGPRTANWRTRGERHNVRGNMPLFRNHLFSLGEYRHNTAFYSREKNGYFW